MSFLIAWNIVLTILILRNKLKASQSSDGEVSIKYKNQIIYKAKP